MNPAVEELANQKLRAHQDEIYRRTDRMFAWLMLVQWIAGIAFAMFVSPRTWSGAVGQTHPHVWSAVILGGILASLPIYFAIRHPGQEITRNVIAVAQSLFSALLIHLSGGRIETHFHVFGSLAFLAFYRDWKVLIYATVIVASDHYLRGAFFPFSVYGVTSGAEWRFLEHAAWVLFEDAFLIMSCVVGIREMRKLAERQAELEIAQEEISRKSAVLNSVLASMQDGVVVANPEGKFLYFNAAAEKILGNGAQDVSPQQWSEMYGLYADESETPYPPEKLPLARAMQGETIRNEEIRVKRELIGDEVWIELSGGPLRLVDGELVGGLSVFRNVTEQRHMLAENARARREAEAANRAKSEFLSRMSHELRTPLNAILGFGQLIKMEDVDPEVEELTDEILKGGKHLLNLINEVLDISRVETGSLAMSREPVQLRGAVQNACSLVRPIADAAGITLTIEDGKWDRFVSADNQRLAQILINLLSNAIKYNRASGSVTVSTRARDEGSIEISVADTGIGISQAKLERLFTPFDRLGAETSTIEGVGLGLALSKRLAEAMRGRLEVESVPGVGTTFTVVLEESADPAAALTTASQTPLLAASTISEKSVVYIEDNSSNVMLVQRILERRPGLELVVSKTGTEGLETVRRLSPDVVLLDLNLPELSGNEILRRLRADDRTSSIPVVILSADATPGQIEALLEAGAFAYLTKPIDVEQFLYTVDGLLNAA